MALNVSWLQNLAYAAQLDRQVIEAIVANEGVVSPLSFKVVPQSPAAMTVKVLTGQAVVKGDDSPDQGMYLVKNTVDFTTATFTLPSAGNHRLDSVCLQVKDPDASGPAGNVAAITIVQGTAVPLASQMSEPTLPATHLRLANIELTSTTTSIPSGSITNRRTLCGGLDHVGTVKQWTGTGAMLPEGWMLAQGQEVSRTTYAELFELVGTTFGIGNGSSTFNLPDLSGRVALGAGSGTNLTPRTLATKSGAETHALSSAEMPSHLHDIAHDHPNAATDAQGSHYHTSQDGWGFVTEAAGTPAGGLTVSTGGHIQARTSDAGSHAHNFNVPPYTGNSGLTGNGQAHNNMPPFIVLNQIIRVQ